MVCSIRVATSSARRRRGSGCSGWDAGRKIGDPDPDFLDDWLDERDLKVAEALKQYTFDFGDNRRHRCEVENEKADSGEDYGPLPDRPVPIWG
jgi:hypothetical protein